MVHDNSPSLNRCPNQGCSSDLCPLSRSRILARQAAGFLHGGCSHGHSIHRFVSLHICCERHTGQLQVSRTFAISPRVLTNQLRREYIRNPSLSYLPSYILSSGPRYAAYTSAHGISTGFSRLHAGGAIGAFLADLIIHITPLQILAAKARRNELTPEDAADLLNSIWCSQLGIYVPKPITSEIEELCWIGIVSYWHVERSSWEATADLSLALYRRLLQTNIHALKMHYPDTVFWLVITAGALLKRSNVNNSNDEALTVLHKYAAALSRVLDIHDWSKAKQTIKLYLWTDVMEKGARAFWNESRALPAVPIEELFNLGENRIVPIFEALPCQFCRKVTCDCARGKADIRTCPSHLRGSLWSVPPSIFSMFCGPVWVPHRPDELPQLDLAREIAKKEGGF